MQVLCTLKFQLLNIEGNLGHLNLESIRGSPRSYSVELGATLSDCFPINNIKSWVVLKTTHLRLTTIEWPNNPIEGREPWSSGYGRRLMIQRSWV